MMTQWPESEPGIDPTTPPTNVGDYVPEQNKPKWPTAIGVIALVAGILGALGGVCGIGYALFSSLFLDLMTQGQAIPQDDPALVTYRVLGELRVPTIAVTLVFFFTTLALIAGGVFLLQTRRSSRRWLMVWSIAKIGYACLYFAYALYYNLKMREALEQTIAETSGAGAQQVQATMQIFEFFEFFEYLGPILYALWYCALPIFLLIWFSRPKIKAQVAEWQ